MKSTYNPSGLLDEAIRVMKLKNDAALAMALGIAPPVVSKARNGKLTIGPSLMLKLHERAGLSLATIRGFVGGAA